MKKTNGNFELESTTISSSLKDFYVPELEGLIGIECFNKIAKFTERFPEKLSPFFGYEIQLGNNNDQADFLFCISDPSSFRNYVNSEISPSRENNFDSETIIGLENFSLLWLDESSNLKNPINNIWFEFDYQEIEKKRPKACFFFGPKINLNHLEVLLLTEKVFFKIFGKTVPVETLKKLLEIYRVLGKHSIISQIGMMNSRNDDNLRLFIQGKNKGWIIPFLTEMDYPHIENAALISMLDICNQNASKVDLDIDISEKIGENLGIECYFNSTEKVLKFLEMLVGRGLATTQKSELLKKYIQSLKREKVKSFQPFFSHFKIGYKPGIGFISKAYFGYVTQTLAPVIIQTKPVRSYINEKI